MCTPSSVVNIISTYSAFVETKKTKKYFQVKKIIQWRVQWGAQEPLIFGKYFKKSPKLAKILENLGGEPPKPRTTPLFSDPGSATDYSNTCTIFILINILINANPPS